MLPATDITACVVRTCLFISLSSVMALIVACQRQQILMLLTGKQEAKSQKINLIMNLIIITGPFLIAILYPKVGALAGILGSFSGCACIYILPTITYLKSKHTEI